MGAPSLIPNITCLNPLVPLSIEPAVAPKQQNPDLNIKVKRQHLRAKERKGTCLFTVKCLMSIPHKVPQALLKVSIELEIIPATLHTNFIQKKC